MTGKITFHLLLIFLELVLCAYSLSLPNKGKIRDDKAERKLSDSLMEEDIQSENTPGDVAPNFPTLANLANSIRKKREDSSGTEHRNESSSEDVCKRHSTLQIKFGDIGMDFIVYPEAFDIGICKGSCRTEDAPITSHNAKIRKLAYEHGLISKQEAPCCVPVEYGAQNVMYRDEEGIIHSVRVSDFTISKCGCI